MNPGAIPAQTTVGGQHGRLNGASSYRLTDRWPVSDENVEASGRRALLQDVVCDRLTSCFQHRQNICTASFAMGDPDRTALPVDIFKGQSGHLGRAHTKIDQASGDCERAPALRKVGTERLQQRVDFDVCKNVW